ncbi:MAG TPA: hypothetical protein VIL74_03790 [Pyrinomonadaceae bacterium]|jgi:uncharacterized membrane protein
MHISGFIVSLVGLLYFILCIGIPKIRPYQKGSDKKIGTVTCIGGIIFFLAPTLTFIVVASGAMDKEYSWIGYLFVCLGVVFMAAGSVVEKNE